jgi:hypothetical protein
MQINVDYFIICQCSINIFKMAIFQTLFILVFLLKNKNNNIIQKRDQNEFGVLNMKIKNIKVCNKNCIIVSTGDFQKEF